MDQKRRRFLKILKTGEDVFYERQKRRNPYFNFSFQIRSDLLEKIIPKKLKGDALKGAKVTLLKDLKSAFSRYMDCTHNLMLLFF